MRPSITRRGLPGGDLRRLPPLGRSFLRPLPRRGHFTLSLLFLPSDRPILPLAPGLFRGRGRLSHRRLFKVRGLLLKLPRLVLCRNRLRKIRRRFMLRRTFLILISPRRPPCRPRGLLQWGRQGHLQLPLLWALLLFGQKLTLRVVDLLVCFCKKVSLFRQG